MLIYVPNEQHEYILIFDIEFDDLKLVEFSGLLFQRIGENVYQLAKSINQYINTDIGYRFVSYTNITSAFLQENGVSLRELQDMLRDFMPQCDVHQLLLVSHGLRSDLLLLQKNGIDWLKYDKFCSYKNAMRILKRQNQLKVKDITEECGYYLDGEHNAYHDVWAHVSIFCYLKKIEFLQEES